MKDREKYIGIFDSGIGGLTLVKYLLEQLPNENIVYLADSKHMPYGDKTNEQIISYVMDDVKFLSTYDLKAIVIACNTADSIASSSLRNKYKLPIYGVIDSTAKKAARESNNNHIGVIATTATIISNVYQEKILANNPYAKVFAQACPFLTPLIEEGKFDIGNQEMRLILEDYLSPLINSNIDTLVLGCTHYDLLTPIIKDMYNHLNIVSSSRCVIDVIQKEIEINKNKNCEQLYFVSSDAKRFRSIASMIIDDIQIRQI